MAAALFAAAVLGPVSAFAQRGQGAAVRVDPDGVLRSGPLSRTPGERAEIVSVAPAAFPAELAPEGATFVTGAVSPSLMVVVSSLPRDRVFFMWQLQWALEDRGWMPASPSRGGFVPAGGSTPAISLCRGTDFAEVGVYTQPDGGRLLRVAVGPDARRGCAPTRGFSAMSDVPVPMLLLPAGVRPSGGGGGGGLDDWEMRARLPTTIGPAELSRDFVAQMEADGWKRQGATSGDDAMRVTRFEHRTRAGDPVTAVLLVTKLGESGSVDAVVRFVRHKSSR